MSSPGHTGATCSWMLAGGGSRLSAGGPYTAGAVLKVKDNRKAFNVLNLFRQL